MIQGGETRLRWDSVVQEGSVNSLNSQGFSPGEGVRGAPESYPRLNYNQSPSPLAQRELHA